MLNAGWLLAMTHPRASGGGGTVPAAPTIGTASVSAERSISVTFTPNSDGGSPILSYTVTSNPGNISASGASSPVVVPNLVAGTAYTFTVTANNAIGSSASSAASNSVTAQGKPNAPTTLGVTAGSGQVTVSFIPPSNNGGSAITGYTVTSSPGGFNASGAGSPITVTGLTNGTAYTFTAVATNAYGNSPASAASDSVRPVAPGSGGPFDSFYAPGWLPKEPSDGVFTKPVQSQPAKSTGIGSPSYTDGNFGTKIYRIAQLSDSPNNGTTKMRHEYSRRCPYNCDSTKYILQNSSGFMFLYDANTFQMIPGGVTTSDIKNGAIGTNSLYPKDPRDWSWHPTDPNLITFKSIADDLKFYQYNCTTKAVTLLFDFTGRLGAFGMSTAANVTTGGEGRPSDDGRYWGFMVKNSSGGQIGYICYDVQTDTIVGSMLSTYAANNVTMSSGGSRVCLGGASQTSVDYATCAARPANQPIGSRAYSRDFSTFKQTHYSGGHADVGYDVNGNEVWIAMSTEGSLWPAIGDSDVFMIPVIGSGGPVKLYNQVSDSSQWNNHISGCLSPGKPGWFILSSWDSQTRGAAKWADNNVILLELKSGGKIYRLANHRTTRFTYWQEPHATASRDGLRINYSCSWDSTSSSNPGIEYMIGLPSWVYGGPAGPTPLLSFTFDSSAGWTLGTSCSITGGKLWSNNTAGNVTNIYATSALPAGTYDIQYTISEFNAGNVTMRVNSGGTVVSGTTRSAGVDPAGTYTDRITIAGTSTEFQVRVTRQGTTMDVKVDNITVTAVP